MGMQGYVIRESLRRIFEFGCASRRTISFAVKGTQRTEDGIRELQRTSAEPLAVFVSVHSTTAGGVTMASARNCAS